MRKPRFRKLHYVFCAIIFYSVMKTTELKAFFSEYAGSFETGDADVSRNVALKHDHTLRVAEEAARLAAAESFSDRESQLLARAALFHDLSRFEQYSRFRTFCDAESFDHGERSYELVREKELLADLPEEEQKTVLAAVRFHNRREVPADLSCAERKILLAVRDADKLDIMPILLAHLREPGNAAIVYGLPETGILSPEVGRALLAGKSPDNRDFKSSLDFLAAKFSWGFDLNYGWTCREFLDRDYMGRLRALLPEKPEILDDVLHRVLSYLKKKGERSC